MKRNLFISAFSICVAVCLSSCGVGSFWASDPLGPDLYIDNGYSPGYYGNPNYTLYSPPPGYYNPGYNPGPPPPGYKPNNKPGTPPPANNNNNNYRPGNNYGGNPGSPQEGGFRGEYNKNSSSSSSNGAGTRH